MKKILCIALIVFSLGLTNVYASSKLPEVVKGKDKVNVYLFWSAGCGGCEAAITEINKFSAKYDDYINIVAIQLDNEANNNLYSDLQDQFGGEGYIPFIVIGEDYGVEGYKEEMIDIFLEEYENEDYKDIVADQIDDDVKVGTLKEACEIKGITYLGKDDESSNESSSWIFVGIFATVVVGIGFLLFFPKSKSN